MGNTVKSHAAAAALARVVTRLLKRHPLVAMELFAVGLSRGGSVALQEIWLDANRKRGVLSERRVYSVPRVSGRPVDIDAGNSK
jgi:hypothetical protein